MVFDLEERFEAVVKGDSENYDVERLQELEVLKCCGCNNITVRIQSQILGIVDSKGMPITEVQYLPPTSLRKTPKWLESREWLALVMENHFVPNLLNQIYIALFNNALALAAMGIRALLERTMIEKCGDEGSFVKNLSNFKIAGFIGVKQIETLKDTLELSHASIHRNFDPSANEIDLALDITESILSIVYIHSEQSAALTKRIPPRNKRNSHKSEMAMPMNLSDDI